MVRCARAIAALVTVAALTGGCHAEPFAPENYGAVGLQVPGPEALIATTSSVPEWLADGTAFYYAGTCFSRTHAPRATTAVASVDLMPSGGGSVMWERCEDHISLVLPLDSAAMFPAAAVNANGAVAYVEADKRAFQGVPVSNPVFEHTELWLSDTVESLRNRRHLMTLYRDNNGVATVGPGEIDWFIAMRWLNPTALLALAVNFRPGNNDSSLGVARISINDAGATAAVLPGSETAISYSLASGGSLVVFARDSVRLFSLPLSGGSVTALPSVPRAVRRLIMDVSCVGMQCLVLTVEPGQSIFWRLDLAANTLVELRRDGRAYRYARWSPTGGAVLVGESDGAHRFTDLMP